MTDRIPLGQLTSDQYDALQLRAARMEHATKQAAELAVRLEDADAGITAAIRQRKTAEERALRAEQRAERAEAVLARVRAHAADIAQTTAAGTTDYDIGSYELACAILTALDEPKEH